jgi:murein DD-endopeptidase MepM/ murein hydrolase activator NlpD
LRERVTSHVTRTAVAPVRRGPRRAVGLALLAVLALAAPVAAQDRDPSDISDELERNQQRGEEAEGRLAETEQAIVAARDELVMLRARLDDAQGRLRQLEGQLALADQELDAAEARRIDAERELAEALQALEETEAELAVQEQRFRGQVASTYKYGAAGRSAMFLQMVRTADSPSDLASRLYELKSIVSYQADVVDRVEALRAEREDLRARSAANRRAAEDARDDAADAVDFIQVLRDEAAVVTSAIAADEARQAEILSSLEGDRAALERVLGEVAAEEERLQEELEAERARRAATGSGVCAVDGAKAGRDFSNDWGWPRSGGRSHEGTDIFAARGTPVRAMYAGTIKELRRADTGLGGIYVSYWSGPGEHWYNAHLDTIVAGLAVGDRVEPGTLLGTVGNSGNARTTPPHLHIGHYVDDVAQNPYPVLEQACRG